MGLGVPIVDRLGSTAKPCVTSNFLARAGKQTVTDDPFFCSVQREGFHLQWLDGEPRQERFRAQRLDAEKEAAFHEQHVRLMEEVRCTFRVRSAAEPAGENEFLHQVFAIYQGTKWRSIYNMRPMNSHLRVRKFKMTGTSMWKSLICKDLFMATLDIKDAYLHVPIAKESRRFMRYQWRGEIFELGALPFGLGQAPYVFTRLLQPLLARWRSSLGIVIIAWLDDIIMGHKCKKHLKWAVQSILDDLSDVGLAVNTKPGKSMLMPSRVAQWCGLVWDTKNMTVQVPKKRRTDVAKAAGKLLRRAKVGKVCTRELAVVVGKITATAEAVLPQRCNTMDLVRDLGRAVRRTGSYEAETYLSDGSITQLEWWKTSMAKWNGRSWAASPPIAAVLTTDASPWGYGATLRMRIPDHTHSTLPGGLDRANLLLSERERSSQEGGFQRQMKQLEVPDPNGLAQDTTGMNLQVWGQSKRGICYSETAGLFSEEESARWQNEREALGVRLSLEAFDKQLRTLKAHSGPQTPVRILIRGDNQSVVAAIRRQGSTRPGIGRIVEAFMRKAFEEGFLLQAAWIPGTEMEADALSRELAIRDTADWRVCPRVFNEICDFMGCTPEIDLFASRMNTQVSQFYSLNPDPRALDFDALSEEKNWADFSVCYAAPPTKLIPKMLAKIVSTRARVLAFIPRWTTAPWWATVLTLAGDREMMTIPLSPRTVWRGNGINPLLWPGKTAVAVMLG